MKKSVKIFSVFLAGSLLLSATSCQKAGTELSQLMIIQGIGIDEAENGYKVTVEILNNEQSGTPSGNGSSEKKTKIYTAEGESVSAALRTLTSKSGNLPLFAHNRVIVIGEGAANKKLSDVLDFFLRNYDSRASQLICVAKDSDAEKIIRAKLLNDTVKSEILENMLLESHRQSLIPRVRVVDAINILNTPTAVLCLPAVATQKNGENEDYKLDGCALYGSDETFSMYLGTGDALGLSFLTDTVQKGFLTADLPNGEKAGFVINKSKTHFKISQQNGVLHYNLRINISCDIDDVSGAEFFSTDDDFFEVIKSSVAKTVIKRAENTLVVLKGKHGGDALRYGKRLMLYNPRLYDSVKDNWDAAFKNAVTTVTVKVTVRRIGEETFYSKKQ